MIFFIGLHDSIFFSYVSGKKKYIIRRIIKKKRLMKDQGSHLTKPK